MDVSAIVGASSILTQQQTAMQASMLVLKKAIDLEAANALQLLQTLPQAASNPTNLGNSVDIRA
jgi:hypothetical protein